jgi:cytochrome P450
VNEIRSREFIQSDPPRHTRMRSPLVHPFAPRAIEAWRGLVRETVDGLIDRVSHRRSMDVRADLAIPLPVAIIAAMLGVPADDRSFMKAMAEKRASSHRTLGAGRMRTSVEGFERTNAYLGHAIDARRAAPTEDILSLLATAEKEGVYSRRKLWPTPSHSSTQATERLSNSSATVYWRSSAIPFSGTCSKGTLPAWPNLPLKSASGWTRPC